MTITPNAMAFENPAPMCELLWAKISKRPKINPPSTVAVTRPRPPSTTTTNAVSVYCPLEPGVIDWIMLISPPAIPAQAAPMAKVNA